MPTDRSEFQIKISTSADLSGLKAAQAALEGQRAAFIVMGKDYSELDAKLEANRKKRFELQLSEIAGTKGMGDAVKEAGEAVGEAGEKPDAFRLTLDSYEKLQQVIESYEKAVGKLGDNGHARGEWAEALRAQLEKSHVAAAGFMDDLDRIATRQERLAQVTDSLIAKMREQAEARAGLKRSIEQEIGKQEPFDKAEELAGKELDEAKNIMRQNSEDVRALDRTIQDLNAKLAAAQAESAGLIAVHNAGAEAHAQSELAPETIAAQNERIRRAVPPDQGASGIAQDQSFFNTLSGQAADAMNRFSESQRARGVMPAPSVRELIGLVQALTTFLAQHPALDPQAHDDMQYEIDQLKAEVSALTGNGINRP